MDHGTPHRTPGDHARRGYEATDLSLRALILFVGGLALVTGVVLLLMGWMFGYFATLEERADLPPSPLAATRRPPPEPRLQVIPAEGLKAMRAEEEALLTTYGWVDRQAGIVRIPVERAIELLGERGLPARRPGGKEP
jgi:hypothetical protein